MADFVPGAAAVGLKVQGAAEDPASRTVTKLQARKAGRFSCTPEGGAVGLKCHATAELLHWLKSDYDCKAFLLTARRCVLFVTVLVV